MQEFIIVGIDTEREIESGISFVYNLEVVHLSIRL